MDIQLLANADQILSKCGRPLRSIDGTVFLPIPMRFFFQANHEPMTTETEAQEIYGDTVFMLRSVGIVPPVNELYWRLQFPNRRYLQNVNRTMSQVANVASQRYPLVPEVPCAPGSRMLITLDDRPTNGGAGAASVTPVQILFGGVYLYTLRGSTVQPINPLRDAALMARYLGDGNQNILAPEIALSLGNASTPQGFIDSPYTLVDPYPVTPGLSVPSAGPLAFSRSIQILGMAFFQVRRLIFRFTSQTGGLSGTLLVRVRDSSGHELTSDYIEVDQFSNAPYACDYSLCGQSSLIFDYSVVDVVGGPGTWNLQCFVEGVRRRNS